MKKIALLSVIFCAGALNGMESERAWDKEVQRLIFEHKNLASVVKVIKDASSINKELNKVVSDGMYANQRAFTQLVHMLADRFVLQAKSHILTTDEVASMLSTPAAKVYLELGNSLLQVIGNNNDPVAVAQLVKRGADINFSQKEDQFTVITPLSVAIEGSKDGIVKLLLTSGVKPRMQDVFNSGLIATRGNLVGVMAEKAMAIQQMLEDANKRAQK